MKKIITFLILTVICFLPGMVDAKVSFEYKEQYKNKLFFHEENQEYFFADFIYNLNEDGSIKVYDINGNIIKTDKYMDELTEESFINSSYFNYFNDLYSGIDKYTVIDVENKRSYRVDYWDGYFCNYEYADNFLIYFEDNLEYTRKVLGKKYDIYLKFLSENNYIDYITKSNDYYIVSYYENDSNKRYVSILDNELSIIAKFNRSDFGVIINVNNDLIYVMENNYNLKVFDFDGNVVGELVIDNDFVLEDRYRENSYCGDLYPIMIYIVEDDLFIDFNRHICPERVNYNDESFFDSTKIALSIDKLTLKYKINFDINKIESNNGDFTYLEKEDEDGKSYVELKITPKNGYIVDKIIVTDTNGNKIEVVDNKFYKPMKDVSVEVQYKKAGEYVPIPDTFLGKSLTLIIIGFILIGLGVYTVNYVKN